MAQQDRNIEGSRITSSLIDNRDFTTPCLQNGWKVMLASCIGHEDMLVLITKKHGMNMIKAVRCS